MHIWWMIPTHALANLFAYNMNIYYTIIFRLRSEDNIMLAILQYHVLTFVCRSRLLLVMPTLFSYAARAN